MKFSIVLLIAISFGAISAKSVNQTQNATNYRFAAAAAELNIPYLEEGIKIVHRLEAAANAFLARSGVMDDQACVDAEHAVIGHAQETKWIVERRISLAKAGNTVLEALRGSSEPSSQARMKAWMREVSREEARCRAASWNLLDAIGAATRECEKHVMGGKGGRPLHEEL